MRKMCDKTITIYCSYVNELTRSVLYSKYVIKDCFISVKNSSEPDSTGEKSSTFGKVLIPLNKKILDNLVAPEDYVGQIGKVTFKIGDYIVEGFGDKFTTLEEMKSKHTVYEIKTANFNLYGTEPHIYLEVI